MKSQVDKRIRIAKVRSIEKRMAELALARADRELRHVESIAARLTALKADLGTAGCKPTGASLAAKAEITMRLDGAASATAKPLLDAMNRRVEKHNASLVALRKSDGADTLLERASVAFVRAHERRADANRIARRVDISGDDI